MTNLAPKPGGNFQWIDNFGKPLQILLNWVESLDALVRGLFGYGPFINAANDAAAAAAGVRIGQVYRNGSVLQIRVT